MCWKEKKKKHKGLSFLTVEKISRQQQLSMFLLPSEKSKSLLVRSSHHVGVLVLQLVQLFALLPQEQDSGKERHDSQKCARVTWWCTRNLCFYLCSLSVAWISHTLTRERRFFISVQISDMYRLPMLWKSSRSRAAWEKKSNGRQDEQRAHRSVRRSGNLTCFSVFSEGHPWMCLVRFSLKCAAREGVKEPGTSDWVWLVPMKDA